LLKYKKLKYKNFKISIKKLLILTGLIPEASIHLIKIEEAGPTSSRSGTVTHYFNLVLKVLKVLKHI